MAEICINALKQSSLYASSIQGQGADSSEYVYDLPRSTVNYFKDRHVRVKINQTDPNSTFSVEIPAFGVLRGMTLHTTFTWTQATPAGGASGTDIVGALVVPSRDLYANICKRFSLMNSSREIQNLPSDILKLRVKQMPADERARWELAGYANVAVGKNIYHIPNDGDTVTFSAGASGGYVGEFPAISYGTVTLAANAMVSNVYTLDVYTPILFSCFEKGLSGSAAKNCFNTRFLERLSVQGEINGIHEMLQASTAVALGVVPSISKMELLCDFDVIETRDLDKIEQANYSLDTPLSIIQGNVASTEKSYTASAGSNSVTMSLFNTQLAHSLVVTVRPKRSSTRALAVSNSINLGTSTILNAQGPSAAGAGVTDFNGVAATASRAFRAQQHSVHADDNSRIGADYKKIKSFKLEVAGRVIYEAKTYAELMFLTAESNHWREELGGRLSIGECNDAADCNASNILVIPFAEKEKMLNHLSGSLAMKGLNSCQLTLTFDSINTTEYIVQAHVCYCQALSVESNSGRIAISVST